MKKRKKKPYKEPVFLFTSCSLRQAAWAGWHSAFGDRERAENFCHSARAEWVREIGGGRRYPFLRPHNYDIYSEIRPEVLRDLIDKFLKSIKREIKRKSRSTAQR
jgi:hypothetical protein